MKDIFLKLMFNIPKTYIAITIISLFSEGKKIEKVGNIVANLHDKEKYVIHINNLKQALDYGLVLKKENRITKSNQKAWLKPYIDINEDLRKKNKT